MPTSSIATCSRSASRASERSRDPYEGATAASSVAVAQGLPLMRLEMTMTRSNMFKGLLAAIVAVALLAPTATDAAKPEQQDRGVTNILLVHGAWADGSSWSKVIPL